MFQRFLIGFIVFFFFETARADLYTPLTLNLNNQEFENVLNRYFEEGFKVDGKLSEMPKIKGLKAEFEEINYHAVVYPQFLINQKGEFSVEAKLPEAYFEMKNISLQHKMVRKIGSTRINVKTNIKCEYLKISLKEKINYLSFGKFTKQNPEIISAALPSNLDFILETKNCEGPEDFEVFLPKMGIEWLASKSGIKETLLFLNEEIIKNFWQDLLKGIGVDFFGQKVFLALLGFERSGKDFHVNVMLRWPKKDKFYLNIRSPEVRSGLAIDSKDLSYVIDNWLKGNCFDLSYKRSDIDGVDKLFGNRFYQFFIWSDLANFNKNANFNLKIKVCLNNVKLTHVQNNEMSLSHNADVYIQMNFLGAENKELPYLFLWSKASGQINLKTSDKGMVVQLKNTGVDFKYKYHPEMYTWRKSKASGGPALGTIMSFVLPEIEKLQTPVLNKFDNLFKNKKINYSEKGYLEVIP